MSRGATRLASRHLLGRDHVCPAKASGVSGPTAASESRDPTSLMMGKPNAGSIEAGS